jgi:hypothetical protein
MKNVLLTALALIMLGVAQCVAQGQKYSITRITYQSNEDVEVALKRKRAELNNNRSLIAVQRVIAKKIASAMIKNEYKKAEESQYVYGFCNGEFINYSYWDIDANRSVVLCPQMGRITINDWANRKSIVAFPMLKVAMVVNITKEQIDVAAKQKTDVKSIWEAKPLYDFQEVVEINGFPACTNYAYTPVQEGQEVTGQTAVVDGVKVVLFPMPGHNLMKNDNEYYIGIHVDGENNSPKANFSLELLELGDCSIDEANFVLPDGYKIFMDYKSLNKAVKKGVKENKHILPDPGKMPEVVWP